MNRTDALAYVINKWRKVDSYKHGDCAECVFDYVEARTGKRPGPYSVDEKPTVKRLKELLGKPEDEGEVCLFKHGMAIVLPYGGMCGVFGPEKGFDFNMMTPEKMKAVRFVEAD